MGMCPSFANHPIAIAQMHRLTTIGAQVAGGLADSGDVGEGLCDVSKLIFDPCKVRLGHRGQRIRPGICQPRAFGAPCGLADGLRMIPALIGVEGLPGDA